MDDANIGSMQPDNPLLNTVRNLQDQLSRVQQELVSMENDRDRINSLLKNTVGMFHKVMAVLPQPIIGIDVEGLVVFNNTAVQTVLEKSFLGSQALEVLPESLCHALESKSPRIYYSSSGRRYRIEYCPLGGADKPQGCLLILNLRE